ncbi:DUF1080 domain-containing protein [Persicitalea sp.]|uniref:3-keto-disaccharide hydrolase n=1 Tax=Persicitalea sp. TaxID=3100273 RepID=UPI0035933F13
MKKLFIPVLALTATFTVQAQLQPKKMTPESSEVWSPEPRLVTPGAPSTAVSGFTAPSDAIVLFDGRNLDEWESVKGGRAGWNVAENAIITAPGKGGIQTKRDFGDFQLHIEWRSPAEVKGNSQGRGNSGVFMQGLYELQVLDSYDNRTYSNGQAGSIYKQTMPLVNAAKKPGEWQTYDVAYTAPRFNKDGMMLIPPYITVFHNGVLIQNHTAIQGHTDYIGRPTVKPHGRGPLMLQDHGNTTGFRNVWIREL